MPRLGEMDRSLLHEINLYRREVANYWIELAAGGVMGVVGFVASATAFVIPAWVWWALGLIFLTVAQFQAYRADRRRLDALEAANAEQETRRLRLARQRELVGETCLCGSCWTAPN